jgi:hypothetical protein
MRSLTAVAVLNVRNNSNELQQDTINHGFTSSRVGPHIFDGTDLKRGLKALSGEEVTLTSHDRPIQKYFMAFIEELLKSD